jgi:ATP-binding cassette subfamily C protein CydCD
MKLDQRLLHLARQSRWLIVLTVGLGLAGSLLTVLQARYMSRVISRVFLDGQRLDAVARLLGLLLGIVLARAFLDWASEAAASAAALRIKTSLRQRLFSHLLALGPVYARGERTGELTAVAVDGIQALEAYFSQYLPQLALAALVPIVFLLLVFPIDLLSGVILLVTAPLIPLFMILIGNLAQELTRRQWQTLSRMSAYFLDVLQGLTTLKLLGRSKSQEKVISQVSERFGDTTMNVLRVTFLSALALEMVATLSTAVVAVEIGLRLLYGQLAFEQAFFILLLAPEFYLPLRMLGTRFHAGMSGVSAAKRIFEILETPTTLSRVEGTSSNGTLGQEDLRLTTAGIQIRFEDVYYTYPGGGPALRGVTFEIDAGQKVALVGPSGAGKSTLASLLLRFIEASQGCIRVNGLPLEQLDPDDWRSQVAWVPQHPYLFHASVADNICLEQPQASLEQVVQAARLAQADGFIRYLPQGYDTQIGERGVRLSGGQAQRIALARAFLKDAPILILDEASANLDPFQDAKLQEATGRLVGGRTVLIIAHRLSSVYRADRIIVLDQGRLVESGTHASLLQREGLYWRLVGAAQGTNGQGRPQPGQPLAPALPFPAMPLPVPAPLSSPAAGRSPLLRLLSLMRPFKGLVASSALMGFATIASSIGLMTTSAYIISAAALHPSIAVLQVAIVGVRFFGITRGLFRYLERYSAHRVTFRLLAQLRVWFYRSLEPLAPARLMRFQSGDLLARILADIESLENFYVRVVAPPLVALLVLPATALFLAHYSLTLALALLAFMLGGGVGVPLFSRWLARQAGPALVQQRAALNSCLVDGIQGMADLLAFDQGSLQRLRVAGIDRSLAGAQAYMAKISALQSGLEGLLANLCAWTVLCLAIPQVRSGRIQGIDLAVLVLAALTSFEALLPLPRAAQYLQANLLAARRLFEITDAEPEVVDPPSPLPPPENFDLNVRRLSFQYPHPFPCDSANLSLPSDLPYALKDLSFSLEQGKRLAIVGPNGAGKSTLVHLLLRFWEYRQGSILLGGGELRTYAQDELRARTSVVSQNTFLFNASVADNLRIARPDASQAEITQAARQAQIHDFIQALPQGYDTWIGEQGLRLSGGERQRLAIARALLKDAPLLILDEATSNLDAETERQVWLCLQALMAGRTTLVITHRLSGLESMDEILALQAGHAVERGSHADLLALGGLYCHMWELERQVFAERESIPI